MQDALNAFLYRDADARGGEGALAGTTLGVKANIAVKGMPFHAGIGAWEDRLADGDAETVRRLRNAGARITGILNMEEGALGAKTDNPHFGPTENPHKQGYSPGGSSGGSGAAVAAGLCDAALGTDTMGSVRIPAAHCGVYGFKPATARVSQRGLEPADFSLDAIGGLARDLDVLERVCRVMSEFGDGALSGKGAVLAAHGVDIEAGVGRGFQQAAAALEFAPVEAVLSQSLSRIRFAGFIQVSKTMAEHLRGVAVSAHLSSLLAYGQQRSSADFAEDRSILSRAHDEVRALIAKHGFLIMPTVPNAAFAHNAPEPVAQADFTCLANIAGLPALAIPAGWNDDGLPVGVQLVGPAGCEGGLFALARQIDAALGAYRAPLTFHNEGD